MSTGTFPQLLRHTRQRWWVVGLVLLLGLLTFQYSSKVAVDHRSAILRWRPQILQLDDVNIYERFTYPNPPIMALLLKPFVQLPPLAASLTWFFLKVALTVVACAWVFRLVESPGQAFPTWAKGLAILLSLRPIIGDLTHGNINLFILFLVIAALYAFQQGKDWTAGILLALAIACKVTPALFLPYFLWKRAWKTLAGCVLGLGLFLVVVPGLFLGMSRNLELLTSWYGCMVKPFVVSGTVTTEHLNQSLPGLVHRWFGPAAALPDAENGEGVSPLAVVEPYWLGLFLKGCMGLFAVLVVWTCRTPTHRRHGWPLAAEFSLVLLGMLLFSERTWKHHCVTLLLPFSVLSYYLATCRPTRMLRTYLIGTIVGVVALMTTTMTGLGNSWNHLARLAHADGAYVWAYLLLLAALAAILRRLAAAKECGAEPRVMLSQPSVRLSPSLPTWGTISSEANRPDRIDSAACPGRCQRNH